MDHLTMDNTIRSPSIFNGLFACDMLFGRKKHV